MGRLATGALLTTEAKRIDLKGLLRTKHLEHGYTKQSKYSWTCGNQDAGNIGLIGHWSNSEKYIRLVYKLTDHATNEKIEYDYKINLVSVQSNLGNGEVLYFECPVTKNRCRILYMAYGSHIFKSREAYSHRLYYPSQMYSRLEYPAIQSNRLEKTINEIRNQKYLKLEYDGKPTRTAKRLEVLRDKQYDAMMKNESILMARIEKLFRN